MNQESPNFLARMAASSRARAESAEQRRPAEPLAQRVRALPPPPPLQLSPQGFDLIAEVKRGMQRYLHEPEYQAELGAELRDWVGRPTALTHARGLSSRWGVDVWLKREDLAHTGAHKINNALGQALLAKRLGAKRVIAETGAGQHGVATAAACARVGIPCMVYMGAVDVKRQAPNVDRMVQLGAEVVPVTGGDQTLRAAIDEAFRDWVSDPDGSYYLLGSAVGPHPYPLLVRELQSIIGREARAQLIELTGGLPDAAFCLRRRWFERHWPVSSAGGRCAVELIGVEAGGRGANWATMPRHSRRAAPASCMARTRCCCRTRTARCRRPIRFRRAWTIRASAPSTHCCALSVA